MALVLETGVGVPGANSYVTAAFVLAYLTARGRETENSWSSLTTAQQEEYCVSATDYVDFRWGHRFKGSRAVYYDGAKATGQLTFSGNPSDGDTVTVGHLTYTFKNSLTSPTPSTYEVLIGGSASVTIDNLVAAINGTGTSGTDYSSNVYANPEASASDADPSVNLTAAQYGLSGNDIACASSDVNITASSFVNGREYGSQPLEFPRSGLYDQDGVLVQGIPTLLKNAVAEYAVRAVSASLAPDPVVAASGRAVIQEKVGPLETRYASGASLDYVIKPYPTADRMLRDYIKSPGVIR